jgi:hypothetical protein
VSDVRIASGVGYWSVSGVNTSSGRYKVRLALEQAVKAPTGEKMYNPTLSLTSSPDRGDKRHIPAALPSGKTRYPLYRRLGGPQDRSGRVRKISAPPGFDLRTFSESLYRLSYLGPPRKSGAG